MSRWLAVTTRTLTAGLSGARRQGCVALSDDSGLRAVCQQERIVRTRGAGFNWTGLPDESLDAALQQVGAARGDIGHFVFADGSNTTPPVPSWEALGRHHALAAGAYLTSPFSDAVIVICDHSEPGFSVWTGAGQEVTRVEWPRTGADLSQLYSQCAHLLGLGGDGRTQRLEALARLSPDARDSRIDALWDAEDDGRALPSWTSAVETMVQGMGLIERSRVAAALQARLIDLLLERLRSVAARTGARRVCLGGSLFYHSSVNTAVRLSGTFERAFVPVDPGEAGMAVGASLLTRHAPALASPFLGPSYSGDEIKETLDNCKLLYSWESDQDVVGIVAEALTKGRLVGWFDGGMEWGPRSLGARCILANPFAPYLLENLNRFLKHRDPWRGCALSGLAAAVAAHFDGPPDADFMECDFRPKDPQRFKHALPTPDTAVRVHTVGGESPSRFRRVLEAFGALSGLPFVVNTSFNAFREPIVCSPRDAVRVFYGSGVDLLVLGQFVLRK